MTEREKKELQSQIQILEKNVRDLEEQLHNAYKRINELSQRRQ
jgi:peptidoglycan hydrolase CwlO-like protein